MDNFMPIGTLVGQSEAVAPAITVDGKDLAIKLGEDAVKAHLRSLGCDYCREQLVRMAAEGLELDWRRPVAADTAAFTPCPAQVAHDLNHDVWHTWNDQARVIKQSIRARENKVYSELKAKGLRGVQLRDEAKKALAALPKIEVPKMPGLLDSHPKVEKVITKDAGTKSKGFRSKADAAKSAARTESVERTLKLLEKIAQKHPSASAKA